MLRYSIVILFFLMSCNTTDETKQRKEESFFDYISPVFVELSSRYTEGNAIKIESIQNLYGIFKDEWNINSEVMYEVGERKLKVIVKQYVDYAVIALYDKDLKAYYLYKKKEEYLIFIPIRKFNPHMDTRIFCLIKTKKESLEKERQLTVINNFDEDDGFEFSTIYIY